MRTDWQPASFDEYFEGFLAEHTQDGTRWCHFAMLHLAVVTGTIGIAKRSAAIVASTALGALAIDLGSHLVFEGGYPGRSLSRPLWSVRANVIMASQMWRGIASAA